MSHRHSVHVGPYAKWEQNDEKELPEEVYAFLLGSESGIGLAWHDDLPGIWTPSFRRAEFCFAPRRFNYSDAETSGADDLTGVDQQAEIEWFRTTFKEQIDLLARHYGKPPTFHWGIVSS